MASVTWSQLASFQLCMLPPTSRWRHHAVVAAPRSGDFQAEATSGSESAWPTTKRMDPAKLYARHTSQFLVKTKTYISFTSPKETEVTHPQKKIHRASFRVKFIGAMWGFRVLCPCHLLRLNPTTSGRFFTWCAWSTNMAVKDHQKKNIGFPRGTKSLLATSATSHELSCPATIMMKDLESSESKKQVRKRQPLRNMDPSWSKVPPIQTPPSRTSPPWLKKLLSYQDWIKRSFPLPWLHPPLLWWPGFIQQN